MDKNVELIEGVQTTLGHLQRQYEDRALEFWALRLAWGGGSAGLVRGGQERRRRQTGSGRNCVERL